MSNEEMLNFTRQEIRGMETRLGFTPIETEEMDEDMLDILYCELMNEMH